uniref:Right handed beta helix domain-containing protein n=1 Tax=Amphimedon queenslandica TaxID=400682 RepID=A0A1X7U284_AMPQE
MSLLLVVVLLFFSSSCSVSSGQYYVSDDCSSVTQSPCNPLSVYAGNMSQYNNTIFYFIGTSVINFNVTMDSVQNITLHGLDQSPAFNCSNVFIAINTSSHVSFSNISFQQCNIDFQFSSNITITGSIFQNPINFSLLNTFDSKITSSAFDNVTEALLIYYYPPPVCYNELHHYSLTLTNVTVTNGYLVLNMFHGTSYNISVTLNIINSNYGIFHYYVESLFSLYITKLSWGRFTSVFFSNWLQLDFDMHSLSLPSKYCNIKSVESQSTIVIEDSQFLKTRYGLSLAIFRDYFQISNYHIAITVKSCSIRDNDYGLSISGSLSTSTHISVINTELVRNRKNTIVGCRSIILNNVTVTNSPSTGLVIISSVVTVENRLVFKNNTGVVGGGMAINGSSVVALSPSANLEFIDNHATYKGGGIYIDKEIQNEIDLISFLYDFTTPLKRYYAFTFEGNTAGVAGNDIYGVDSALEYFAASALASLSTSSDASAFALCDPDSNETTPI